MSSSGTQPEVFTRTLSGGHSPWVVILALLSALGCISLVMALIDGPEMVIVSDDLSLSQFIWVQGSGPRLGVDVQDTGGTEGGPVGTGHGVLVSRVMLDSPAQAAGLIVGDRIVGVDGQAVDKPLALSRLIAGHKVGDIVCLTVDRNRASVVLHAKLDSAPSGRLAAATGLVDKAWLGVDLQPVDQLMVQRFGLPDTRGTIVSYVHSGSPAARAGLVQGDVIRRAAGRRLRSVKQFDEVVSVSRPGDALQLVLWHAGSLKEVQVVLATRPPPGSQPQPALPEAEVEIEAAWLGLDIVPLDPAEADELGLPVGSRGMVVDGVARGSGTEAGFLVGDVIIAVNGQPTNSVGQFKDATEGAIGALVDIIRYGRHIYISVPPPEAAMAGGGANAPVRQVFFGPQ